MDSICGLCLWIVFMAMCLWLWVRAYGYVYGCVSGYVYGYRVLILRDAQFNKYRGLPFLRARFHHYWDLFLHEAHSGKSWVLLLHEAHLDDSSNFSNFPPTKMEKIFLVCSVK